MSIQAQVVNRFKATEHEGLVYVPGDIYPAEGFEADAERVAFLASVHPKYGKIYLANVQENENTDINFPKHVGGGTYELSNGEQVKGKENATQAEQALKE